MRGKENKLMIKYGEMCESMLYDRANVSYANRHYDAIDFDTEVMTFSIREKKRLLECQMSLYIEPYVNAVTLILDKDGSYSSSKCGCGFNYKYSPCGHVWILARYLASGEFVYPYDYKSKYHNDIQKFFREINKKKMVRMAKSFSDIFINDIIEEDIKKEKYGEDSVFLTPYIYDVGRLALRLRFKIGRDKGYIVKDLHEKLLSPLKNEEYVDYGKHFKTVLNIDFFDEKSKKCIDFIKRHIEKIEKDKMEIAWNEMDEFFDLFIEDNGLEGLRFVEKEFPLTLNIDQRNDYYIMNIDDENTADKVLLGEYDDIYDSEHLYYLRMGHNKYIITKKRFYELGVMGGQNALFYMDITADEERFYQLIKFNRIYFSRSQVVELLDVFKNRLPHIEVSESILKEFSNDELVKPQIYCDINEEMALLLRIKYHDTRFGFFFRKLVHRLMDGGVDQADRLLMQNAGEEVAIDEAYNLDDSTLVAAFIENTLPHLTDCADVFLSEGIKHYSVARTVSLSVGVKVKSDLIILDFQSDDLDKKEFYEILSRYRRKKKYYQMKSGEIIKIDDRQMKNLDEFVKDMGIGDAELKSGKAKVPAFRRFRLSDEVNITIETDKKFKALFDKKNLKIAEKFEGILRDYQKTGVEFMLSLRNMKLGGILADDMGLGKTLQVVALLESVEQIEKREKPSIIVTPASLILNWENEFEKFHSDVKIVPIYGDKVKRREMISSIENEVVITSYDYLKRDIEEYEKMAFDMVIIDEAQYIKNYKTKAARSVKRLTRNHALALTGTPIENTLAEIWSIFDFLMPGYLFSYSNFNKNYEKPIVLGEDENISHRLKRMVEPFILRRLKKDVLSELPDKIEEIYFVELSEEEKQLYRANLLEANDKLHSDDENKIIILAMLTRLRQLCIDPSLVYDRIYGTSSKIKMTMDLIVRAIANDKKVLLFSSFTSVLDKVSTLCDEQGIDYLTLTGSTKKEDRQRYVDMFQTGDIPLFLISLKAGGTGLNLTEAGVVIHVDPWWNVSAQNQATDRAHRIGQKNTVQVIRLIAKNTIEEKIQVMQEKKKELSDTFVEHSEGSFSKLSKEELLELFSAE